MRTNIDIDDALMSEVLSKGPYKTKKEAVEAGLRLITRQAIARELLKLEGKLDWGWGEEEERLNGEPNWSVKRASHETAAKPAASKSTPKSGAVSTAKSNVKARRVSR